MDDAILAALERYITTTVLKQPERQIAADAPLITSGLVDSFSLVDLALFIEDTFGVHLADTELNAQSFDSLRQLIALIESRKAG